MTIAQMVRPPHRPKLASGERRDVMVKLRVRAATVAEWDAAAERAALTRSEWMRSRLADAVAREEGTQK